MKHRLIGLLLVVALWASTSSLSLHAQGGNPQISAVIANASRRNAGIGPVVRDVIYLMVTSLPADIRSGTIRIMSAGVGYDSGVRSLTLYTNPSTHQPYLYYCWLTAGLQASSDYIVTTTLQRASGPSTTLRMDLALARHLTLNTDLVTANDVSLPYHQLGLTMHRTFRHDPYCDPYNGSLGMGWTHDYDVNLQEMADGVVCVHTPLGASYFQSQPDGSFASAAGASWTLRRSSTGRYSLQDKLGTSWQFNSNRRLESISDPQQHMLSMTYDSQDRLSRISDTTGQYLALALDSFGRIITVTDSVGRIVRYVYDSHGRLISVTAPGNRATSYEYNAADGLTAVVDPATVRTVFNYDTKGRLISSKQTGQTRGYIYAYDEVSGAITLTDPTNRSLVEYEDDAGFPIHDVDSSGAARHFEYDSHFNLSRVVLPDQRAWSFDYDAQDNRSALSSPDGNSVAVAYEPNYNKRTSVTDPGGHPINFEYDARGCLTGRLYPDGTVERWGYDAASGTVQSFTNRRGLTIQYVFDGRGELRSKRYPNGSITTFSYNTSGRLLQATNAAGSIRFAYDSTGLLTDVVYPGERHFRYAYDRAGRRTSMTYPDGSTLLYSYDLASRPIRITDKQGGLVVAYQYDENGRCIARSLANGVTTSYSYDNTFEGRIYSIVHRDTSGQVLSRYIYAYDSSGNRTSIDTNEGIHRYTYDAENQLKSASAPDGTTEQFDYDASWNRKQSSLNGATTAYTVNALNQYTQAGNATCSYDRNGNLIEILRASGRSQYVYDEENKLIQVVGPNGTVNYTYDALGRRCGRSDSHGSVRYLYDGNVVAVEEDTPGHSVASYAWGAMLDEPLQMRRGGVSFFYCQDALNSVTDLTDDKGRVLEHYRYRAYGEPLQTSQLGNPWMFTGAAYDVATNLQYNRARFYNPVMGRFTSPDPTHVDGGVNLYAYTKNNPTTYLDSSGLGWFSNPFKAVTKAIGFVVDVAVAVQTKIVTYIGSSGAASLTLWPDFSHTIGFTIGVDIGDGLLPGQSALSIYYNQYRGLSISTSGFPIYRSGAGGFSLLGSAVGGIGGGNCPTFIQLPLHPVRQAASVTNLDISQKKLAAKITVPAEDCLLKSDIPIFGVAGGTDFKEYRLEYGEGSAPSSWHLIERSTTPQNRCQIGLMEMNSMTGDEDLHGNLATWNTGLGAWVHLPWHPADEKIRLNGIYTLRLVVIGKDGLEVEDRRTCEVGCVIAQCLPGTVTSRDGRMRMNFSEQSLMAPFRLFSIQPERNNDPPLPSGWKPVSSVYRFREPGDRFIKPVQLEFRFDDNLIRPSSASSLAIFTFDAASGKWLKLSTQRTAKHSVLAMIQRLPPYRALFIVLRSTNGSIQNVPVSPNSKQRGIIAGRDGRTKLHIGRADVSAPSRMVGRDAPVGARVDIVARTSGSAVAARSASLKPIVPAIATSRCTRVTNTHFGGNFAATISRVPFDAGRLHIASFDYRIAPCVRADLYARVGSRWYAFEFTGGRGDQFRNQDVNITFAGKIPGVIADDNWHTVRFDLGEMLQDKTHNVLVEELVIADWQVEGYMKLGFGRNPRGATLYLDRFMLLGDKREKYQSHEAAFRTVPTDGYKAVTSVCQSSSSPMQKAHKDLHEEVIVDDFEGAAQTNRLKGPNGAFSNPDTEHCKILLVEVAGGTGSNHALQLNYDVTTEGAYGGYWSALMAVNAKGYNAICLRIRPTGNIPNLLVGIRHAATRVDVKVPIGPYCTEPDSRGWCAVRIPLSAFIGRGLTDLRLLDTFSLTFENRSGIRRGTLLVDDIAFERGTPTLLPIADFGRWPMDVNNLGGGYRVRQTGAATIHAGYHEWRGPEQKMGTVRISYGGSIGKDYGDGTGHAYAAWETDLMGLDAHDYSYLIIKIRGEKGGETPNIYLEDGTTRKPVLSKDLLPLSTEWQELRIPIEQFAQQGIDLSHLEQLALDFEWQMMSGTIYIASIRLERRTASRQTASFLIDRKECCNDRP